MQPDDSAEKDSALDDAWVDDFDELPEDRSPRTFFAETLTGPLRDAQRGVEFIRTTPGQILAMMLVLTLALVAAGVSMSQSMAARQNSLNTLVNSTEPMSNAAHTLITSLSEADTIATTTFVQPGNASEDSQDEFMKSLDAAVIAANQVLQGVVESGSRDDAIRDLVLQIQRDIPVYAGLTERARTNQQIGNPVAVAYMSSGSAVMRDRMLGNAAKLFNLTRAQVADEMERLSSPQWVPLSGLVAALVFLLLAQVWLWRVFRRRLNRGFLVATALMLLAVVWVSVANVAVWRSGQLDFERASTPWEKLTTARIDAQETRTDEIFALLRRQSATETDSTFETAYTAVSEGLNSVDDSEELSTAREALTHWRDAHMELMQTLNSGEFDHALEVLTSAESAYSQLDQSLSTLVSQSREDMRAFISVSLDATRAVSGTVLVLTTFSVIAIWLGIRRRLGEYL